MRETLLKAAAETRALAEEYRRDAQAIQDDPAWRECLLMNADRLDRLADGYEQSAGGIDRMTAYWAKREGRQWD